MKLYFLGTGTSSGVPQMGCSCVVCRSADPRDRRTRCSALVETDDHHLLIFDCGPDFRAQMLRFLTDHPQMPGGTLPYVRRHQAEMTAEQARAAGLHEPPRYDYALPLIDAVLVTHEHFDHVAGLDDLRPFSVLQPVTICAEPRVADPIVRNMFYCFREERYPGSPHLVLHQLDTLSDFRVGTTTITPVRLLHGRLPILGYRIGSLAYLTDMTELPEDEEAKLVGVEVLVVNALRHEAHPTHQSIAEAVAFAHRIGARRTFFTHMSHGAGLHAASEKFLPEGMCFAHDGLSIEI